MQNCKHGAWDDGIKYKLQSPKCCQPKKWIEIKTGNKVMQVYRVFKMENKIWKKANVLRPTGKLPSLFLFLFCFVFSFLRRRWGASKRSLLELSQGIAPVSDPEVSLGIWWERFLDGCAMLHVRSNCWFLVCVSDRPMDENGASCESLFADFVQYRWF